MILVTQVWCHRPRDASHRLKLTPLRPSFWAYTSRRAHPSMMLVTWIRATALVVSGRS